MTNAHPEVPGLSVQASRPESDATRVARTLRRCGPLRLVDLCHEPELLGWPESRIEWAVVVAWSRSLIYIDTRDLLVAI